MVMELVNHPTSTGMMSPRDVRSAGFVAPTPIASELFSAAVIADVQTPFEREKRAFQRMQHSLGKYAGHFIAVHDGKVADFDLSRNTLVRRFFRKYGEGASLYIGFIGSRPSVQVPTPFIRRSR